MLETIEELRKELATKNSQAKNQVESSNEIKEVTTSILNQETPLKLKDPGSFTVPCTLGPLSFPNCLCDLGASESMMPLSVASKLGITNFEKTPMRMIMADRSVRLPVGLVRDYPVSIEGCDVPTDFVVLELDKEPKNPVVFGRPFLATTRATINVQEGKMKLYLGKDKEFEFGVHKKSGKPIIEGEFFGLEELVDIKEQGKVPKRKDGSKKEKSKGLAHPPREIVYLYGEEALALDGFSLKSIFSLAMDENGTKSKPRTPTTSKAHKGKKPMGSKGKEQSREANSPTFTLSPQGFHDGWINYKVKSKGHGKPFAKVRAYVGKDHLGMDNKPSQEQLTKVLHFTLEDDGIMALPILHSLN